MSIVVIAPEPHLAEVKSKLCLLLPDVSVTTIDEVEDADDIDCAVLWKKTPEYLQSFPKLNILNFFRSINVHSLHSNPIHCQ